MTTWEERAKELAQKAIHADNAAFDYASTPHMQAMEAAYKEFVEHVDAQTIMCVASVVANHRVVLRKMRALVECGVVEPGWQESAETLLVAAERTLRMLDDHENLRQLAALGQEIDTHE